MRNAKKRKSVRANEREKNVDAVKDVHRLRDATEARAYLHPVRVRILQMIASNAMTISQVAERLGVHPANLTHHFRKLKQAGLISLVEERDTGRVVEKYYRSVARSFELRDQDVELKGAGQRALALLLDDMRAAATDLAPDARDLICLLESADISHKTFERFQKKLARLAADFREEAKREQGPRSDKTLSYSLNLSLYPRRSDSFSHDANPDRSGKKVGQKRRRRA